MEIWKLIHDFIKVLAWPLLILIAGAYFRKELRELLKKLVSVRLPGGTELTLDPATPEQVSAKREQEVRDLVTTPPNNEPQPGMVVEHNGQPSEVDIRERAAKAEEFVFQQLESEFNTHAQRQVVYNKRPDLLFDGVFRVDREFVFIEVLYLNSNRNIRDLVRRAFSKFDRMRAEGREVLMKGVVVCVADMDGVEFAKLQDETSMYIGNRTGVHDVRVYRYDVLRMQYGE